MAQQSFEGGSALPIGLSEDEARQLQQMKAQAELMAALEAEQRGVEPGGAEPSAGVGLGVSSA